MSDRGPHRNSGRSSSGARARRFHLPPSAHHVPHLLPGFGPDHAIGNLLRRPIRRLHDLHSGQHTGRSHFGRDLSGWLPDGPEGEGRSRPGDLGLRFFHRRDSGGDRFDAGGPRSFGMGLTFRPPRVLYPHVPGLYHPELHRQGIDGQGLYHGSARFNPGHRGHGFHNRSLPFQLWGTGARGRLRIDPRGHGHIRDFRSSLEYRGGCLADFFRREDKRIVSEPAGLEGVHLAHRPGDPHRFYPRDSSGRRPDHRFLYGLYRREENFKTSGAVRRRGHRRRRCPGIGEQCGGQRRLYPHAHPRDPQHGLYGDPARGP
jgi:hypothetical protein